MFKYSQTTKTIIPISWNQLALLILTFLGFFVVTASYINKFYQHKHIIAVNLFCKENFNFGIQIKKKLFLGTI